MRQWCAPTPASWIAEQVVQIMNILDDGIPKHVSGTYHLTAGQPGWKADFVRQLLSRTGTRYALPSFEEICRGKPARVLEPWHKNPAVVEGFSDMKRPLRSVLNCQKVADTFGVRQDTAIDLLFDQGPDIEQALSDHFPLGHLSQ